MEELSGAINYLGSEEEPAVDLAKALEVYWAEETGRVRDLAPTGENDFKAANDLPLARIKRIMKADEDVRMISAEAPVLFAKACELFILELTIRAIGCGAAADEAASAGASKAMRGMGPAVSTGRRTLSREDVCMAIQQTDTFDFLVGVLMPGVKPQYLLDAEAAGDADSGGASSLASRVYSGAYVGAGGAGAGAAAGGGGGGAGSAAARRTSGRRSSGGAGGRRTYKDEDEWEEEEPELEHKSKGTRSRPKG